MHPREHRRLPQRPEPGTDLVDEQLRLFPSREVPALVEPVVMDQVRIGVLCPLPRPLEELTRKHTHGYRDGHALRVEEPELVLPVEATRRDPRVRQPIERDVVEDVVSRETLSLS